MGRACPGWCCTYRTRSHNWHAPPPHQEEPPTRTNRASSHTRSLGYLHHRITGNPVETFWKHVVSGVSLHRRCSRSEPAMMSDSFEMPEEFTAAMIFAASP